MNASRFLLPLTIALLLFAPGVMAAQLNYWSFNTDWSDSMGGNDFTPVNATLSAVVPTFNQSGDGGAQSAAFDYTLASYAYANDTLAGLYNFTISFWYNATGNNYPSRWISTEVAIGDRGLIVGIDGSGYINACFATTNSGVYDHCMYSVLAPTAGWNHIVWVRNATNSVLYVDNVAADSAVGSDSAVRNPGGSLNIIAGSYPGVDSFFYDGLLDEVKIWDTALTVEEVANLYNFGSEAGLCVPDWSCDGYGACLINDTQECNSVTDLNVCGETYMGDYSEFSPLACDYCTPSWNCTVFDACNMSNVTPCLNVSDVNVCGEAFNETLSDYDGSCVYVPCVPNWSCSSFDACSPMNVTECVAVVDANVCGDPFAGNLSDYDSSCVYSPSLSSDSFDIALAILIFDAVIFLIFSQVIDPLLRRKSLVTKVVFKWIYLVILVVAIFGLMSVLFPSL